MLNPSLDVCGCFVGVSSDFSSSIFQALVLKPSEAASLLPAEGTCRSNTGSSEWLCVVSPDGGDVWKEDLSKVGFIYSYCLIKASACCLLRICPILYALSCSWRFFAFSLRLSSFSRAFCRIFCFCFSLFFRDILNTRFSVNFNCRPFLPLLAYTDFNRKSGV